MANLAPGVLDNILVLLLAAMGVMGLLSFFSVILS